MRGKVGSPLKLSARKEKAFELFARGFAVTQVAKELGVAWDTAKRYEDHYEATIKQYAEDNPEVISDVVTNTFRALVELSQARTAAWDRFQRATTDQSRAAFLNLVLKAGSDRAKLFGLLGVKPEYAARMESIKAQMNKLMEFAQGEMCPIDRQRLAEFIETSMGDPLKELPMTDEVVYPAQAGTKPA